MNERREAPKAALSPTGLNHHLLRPVQLITLATVFVGAIFATAEVSTVALTRELGHPDFASLVIGVYAAGSFVVGVIIGGLNFTMPLWTSRSGG